MRGIPVLLALTVIASTTVQAAEPQLVNSLSLPGDSIDARPLGEGQASSANYNRLGFFSDLVYERNSGAWYALSDRGPGGGLIDYETRVQKLRIPVDPVTGAVGTPAIEKTILFVDQEGQAFNGLNPLLLNGDRSQLGRSFDPEGLAVGRRGQLYVADEYGPSVYEFSANGYFRRAFEIPSNLLPKQPNGSFNYVDGRSVIVTGRQDNRGFEGITLNPAGTKLYAVLQDPLVNEGASNDGRRSRNLRIVVFDVGSGSATAQYVYQLEDRHVLNAIDPSPADDFSATNQGRSIGSSSILALSDTHFLVLERDNRGLGVEPTAVPLHKRVYLIDISGATDVSAVSLAGSDALPAGVVPVAKSSWLDLLGAFRNASLVVPEKFEGLAIGPQLTDGNFAVLVGTDNDYSVTQTGEGEQFDVCTDATGTIRQQVALDVPCPEGLALIPGVLASFKFAPEGFDLSNIRVK